MHCDRTPCVAEQQETSRWPHVRTLCRNYPHLHQAADIRFETARRAALHCARPSCTNAKPEHPAGRMSKKCADSTRP